MEILENYNIVADYIASMSPEKTIELHAPANMQKRLEKLIAKEKSKGLTKDEKNELDHYIVLERIIRLAKANAYLRLKQQA